MDFLPGSYGVDGATWFYLSLLLITAIFFRFNRIWSLRNLDLLLLVSLAPGLLLVRLAEASGTSTTGGYAWLLVVTGLLLLRFFIDSWLRRRPRIEQNLNPAGLGFLGIAAFVFLMAEALTSNARPASAVKTVDRANQLLEGKGESVRDGSVNAMQPATKPGPAAPLLAAPAIEMSKIVNKNSSEKGKENSAADLAARLTAIGAHLAVVIALLLVGSIHFGDFRLGLAMAALYLLLPSTSYDVGKVNHVLPAALIAWAVVAYRRPMVAGSLLGLACGVLVFPVFLLPLWLAFYRRRGWLRFGGAVAVVAILLAGSVALTSADSNSFMQQITGSFGWNPQNFRSDSGIGFWNDENTAYRIPARAVFFIMLTYLVVRPQKKTLEHLISHSAAIIVAVQFWYPRHGGEFVLWYLPLALMVVFRPRLTELVPPMESDDRSVDLAKPQQAMSPPSATLSSSNRLLR